MQRINAELKELFTRLDQRVRDLNGERKQAGMAPLPRARVQILGQMSLLANEQVSTALSLAQTADLDAFLAMDHLVKEELKRILAIYGLVYDEDSYLIWIPPKASFARMFEFEQVLVESIDPESALVSKAVKAPEKNLQLIREAIASDRFPTLVDRILENGGRLEDFA